MIIGVGIDIVKLSHFRQKMNKGGAAFIKKVFSCKEQELALHVAKARRVGYYAKRYAAKEAFVKAVGTGFGPIGLQDVWVENMASGQPIVMLGETARKYLKKKYKCLPNIHLSLSDDENAVAIVVLERN